MDTSDRHTSDFYYKQQRLLETYTDGHEGQTHELFLL